MTGAAWEISEEDDESKDVDEEEPGEGISKSSSSRFVSLQMA